MRRLLLTTGRTLAVRVLMLAVVLAARTACARMPTLAEGATTDWIVRQPEEPVTWVAFDPARVLDWLPRALRFVTIGELADGDVAWAHDYVGTHPNRRSWGVSFVEVLRAGVFVLDARAPLWSRNDGAALWCARLAPTDSAAHLGEGQPFLMLDFWISDRAYASYMRSRGHYAHYGRVTLRKNSRGAWLGSVSARGLRMSACATPAGEVHGGDESAGSQALFSPATFAGARVVRVVFAGHRVRECNADAKWHIRGRHPLASADVLGTTEFEYGYSLRGGAYAR